MTMMREHGRRRGGNAAQAIPTAKERRGYASPIVHAFGTSSWNQPEIYRNNCFE